MSQWRRCINRCIGIRVRIQYKTRTRSVSFVGLFSFLEKLIFIYEKFTRFYKSSFKKWIIRFDCFLFAFFYIAQFNRCVEWKLFAFNLKNARWFVVFNVTKLKLNFFQVWKVFSSLLLWVVLELIICLRPNWTHKVKFGLLEYIILDHIPFVEPCLRKLFGHKLIFL